MGCPVEWDRSLRGYVIKDEKAEVPYSNDQELVMDLMRHSPEVEVLEPAELRKKLVTTLQAAAEKNSFLPAQ
ncbi:WYL domain-containing protein [Roseateles noduli]|uniref:WYL domain-containing protein n=1 Tax=Roseateles noduli TaxID=2052484 RepID=UPI003D651FBC